MGTEDLCLQITFNGEIYNHLELRAELKGLGFNFRTRSDTEVLLHGYRAWGEGLPKKLVGMFAFAIADTRNRSLFLARDPAGEKPLFLRESDRAVFFASEPRPLLKLSGFSNRLNKAALARYLCLNYTPGVQTLVEGLEKMSPGTWRRYSADGKKTSGSFWIPSKTASQSRIELTSAKHKFRELFDRSVALSSRADVPLGIFLSGGIDSSLVAESTVRQGLPIHAYCLSFEEKGFSELSGAKAVAKRLGLPLTEVPFGASVLTEFLEVLRHSSDPLGDSSMLPVWALSRGASLKHKVVLGGDGGDELFGGYLTYKASLLHSRVGLFPSWLKVALASSSRYLPTSEGKVSFSYKAARFLRALPLPLPESHFTWNGAWLPSEILSFSDDPVLRNEVSKVLTNLADELMLTQASTLLDFQFADFCSYLPDDILTKMDRMSMAHGLEVRSPFLNRDLIEFAFSLPDNLRVSPGGTSKVLLRKIAEEIFGSNMANAPKQGFSIPIHEWLRGPGRELMDHWLSSERIREMSFLKEGAVSSLLEAHLSRRRSLGFELWGLMVLSQWHQEYLE